MSNSTVNLRRRVFLKTGAALGASSLVSLPSRSAPKNKVVNDISQLNPVAISEERRPQSTEDVRTALRVWPGPVSVGGGRFSMGGQIAEPDSLHLDMRNMNQVVAFDESRKTIRVQGGITWRDIQEVIDRRDLSVKIMQSFSNFTVGGSVSVNCHGRYVGRGPLINSVRAVQIVAANGDILELTRSRDADLFRAVFGGYGCLGVITEVELDLEPNIRIRRLIKDISLERYPEYFRTEVLPDSSALLHNADLVPPNFDAPRATSWVQTDEALTEPERLVRRGQNYDFEKNAIWLMTELPNGSALRDIFDSRQMREEMVVWRNHEASLDTASLEPRTRIFSTYLLQEYFIPVRNFLPFIQEMAQILKSHHVAALNVSIRHAPADMESLLRWAPTEVFSFVLYYKQHVTQQGSASARIWTRALIDAALRNDGRYYLPYRLDATRDQFDRAYPEAHAFIALKRRIDPQSRFKNLLWDRYLAPA
jgi:FAD/FMN-containing dehydrogenase